MTKKKKKAPTSPMASPAILAALAGPSLQDTVNTTMLPPPVAVSGGDTLMRARVSSSSPAAGTVLGKTAKVTSANLAPNTAGRVNSVAGQNTGFSEKGVKINPKHVDGTSGKMWTSFFKDNRSATTGVVLPQVLEGVESDRIFFDLKAFEDETQVPTSLVRFFPLSSRVLSLSKLWLMLGSTNERSLGICRLGLCSLFPLRRKPWEFLSRGHTCSRATCCTSGLCPSFSNLERDEHLTVPVWVQFHNLLLEFWKLRHLGKLCTFIGRPLHTDRLTDSRDMISFARCLVDVRAELELPTHLPVELSDGTKWCQPVLYENVPLYCTLCKRLGHASAICREPAEPTLYVMKKPVKRVERPKIVKKKTVNPASAPKDVWVEVGKKSIVAASVEAQGVSASVGTSSVSVEAPPPPGIITLDTIEEAMGASSEDEGSGDDCVDALASGDDYIEDPGDGVVKGGIDLVLALQALPEAFSTYPPPSTTPILNGGAWPSIQDVARAT